ncbi:C40 family peptidase [Streptomyces sp. V4-01]|uniref:C40 family peptidase n=1 Tax=Actinacidiphila polyblastidii TaxID=3110430 RepID=A0ABU7P7Z7_9ACTN|nr:C40 family peptidase [Streptomyces sp. V4-01]
MSPNQLRTQQSDTHTHTGRRRHAAPSETHWTRRAGLVGGVVSALALCGAAAPAMAENTHGHHKHTSASHASPSAAVQTVALSDVASSRQAAAAFEQTAIQAQLVATQQRDAAAAAKAAAVKKAAQARAAKAAAIAKAAKARAAAQAASRSAARTPLALVPTASTTPAAATRTASASTTVAAASSGKVDQLIAFLKSQLGKPYVYGATGPGSYDCSGLTQAAFASVGVTLPRTSQEQSTAGTPVSVSALQPGDLIFWGGEGSAYHVGVFIGDGQYLDAANPSTPVAIHQLADYMPDWAVRVL